MTRNQRNIATRLWITLWFASALSLSAQGASSPPGFGELIEVRVVNLEVVVEDRRGNRVTGLGREDFRLRVDGREVALDFCSEVVEGRAVRGGSASAPGTSRIAPGRPVGTSYLVFIDDYFTFAPARNRVLKSMRNELSRLGPEDRMAVVAFDGKRLDMLSTWSQSPDQLHRVFDEARQRPALGFVAGAFLRHAELAGTGGFDLVRDLEEKLENVSLAVTATLRSFANPPGRKVMLLLAGGWPFSPQRYVSGSFNAYDRRGERILAPIYQTANLLGYTLYPIDVPGIRNPVQDGRPRAIAAREEDMEDTLRLLAQETGGRAFLDSARIEAFDGVIADTRTYYWLGFTPTWRGDDQNHQIAIELLRPGLRMRYRKSYQDYSRRQEVSFMVESALLLGELPGAQPLQVEVGEPKKSLRRLLIPLKVTFPLDAVTVLSHRGRYETRLEIRIAAVDKNGHRSEVDLIPITLSGTRPPVPGQRGTQEVAARTRRRKHRLVVSVHDPLSGTILASVIDVEP